MAMLVITRGYRDFYPQHKPLSDLRRSRSYGPHLCVWRTGWIFRIPQGAQKASIEDSCEKSSLLAG